MIQIFMIKINKSLFISTWLGPKFAFMDPHHRRNVMLDFRVSRVTCLAQGCNGDRWGISPFSRQTRYLATAWAFLFCTEGYTTGIMKLFWFNLLVNPWWFPERLYYVFKDSTCSPRLHYLIKNTVITAAILWNINSCEAKLNFQSVLHKSF